MNMNNLRPPISIGLFLLVLVLFGCERLSNGVVREIDFPEHTPEIVVTLMARNQMDSLVSRAHSSAGILDSIGSKRIKSALYTLTHEDGTSLTWGGQEDWTSELGHVLTDVELAAGMWSLLVEAEGFESVTAEQRMPPVIDTLGGYALAYDTTLVDFSVEEYDSGKFFLTRTLDLDVNLPNRSGESDFFVRVICPDMKRYLEINGELLSANSSRVNINTFVVMKENKRFRGVNLKTLVEG